MASGFSFLRGILLYVEELFDLVLSSWPAGLAILVGGVLARIENIQPRWLEEELRHGITAFGGGALLSAVSLVLVPQGVGHLSIPVAAVALLSGGVFFLFLVGYLERINTPASNLLAMLADYIPESIALGAALSGEGRATGYLLALLIGLQNLPEGFNAYREISSSKKMKPAQILWIFLGLSFLGPFTAIAGYTFLYDKHSFLGVVTLFSSGGILYLIFEDIAPQSKMARKWLPALGAVLGFLLGMVGHMMLRR